MTEPAPQEACPRCGSSFRCGVQAGEDHCWCFDLPHLPMAEGVEPCLCPACLKQEIERRAADGAR